MKKKGLIGDVITEYGLWIVFAIIAIIAIGVILARFFF